MGWRSWEWIGDPDPLQGATLAWPQASGHAHACLSILPSPALDGPKPTLLSSLDLRPLHTVDPGALYQFTPILKALEREREEEGRK